METLKKKCSKCGEIKDVSEFYKRKDNKDGLRTECKNCRRQTSTNYVHTKEGLITRIYRHQRGNSKKRGNVMPTYTKQELTDWLFSQKLFYELFDNWKASNFDKMLAPSCDRTDDYKGYSLDRLQLMTWQENKAKGHSDRKNGVNNKHSKAVLQFSKEGVFIKEFHSIREAARQLGLDDRNIGKVCSNPTLSAGGFVWRFK